MKLKRLLRKYIEYFLTKFKVLIAQKTFTYKDTKLKYMYKSVKGANKLVVVFSACTRPGLAARYNYVRTLNGMKCNRLYILDDFGYDKRGSYYLGHMPEFEEQQATIALVQKFIKETQPAQVLFCGSCKGGYAALNIGSRFQDSVMIIGEPTYRIASEFALAKDLMRYWMGEVTPEKIAELDGYLSEQLKKNPLIRSQKLHMFYSNKDEYYEPHTKPLLSDVESAAYNFDCEESEFAAHAELGLYFPEFMRKKLQQYL